MKKLLLTLLVLAASLAAFAQAPTYQVTQLGGLPTTVAAVTQTNFPFATAPLIYCGKQANVAVEITGKLSDLGTNLVFTFVQSVSGTYYATNTGAGIVAGNDRVLNITFTNDTTAKTLITNLPSSGIGYWKLTSIYNKHATETWTNLGVWYAIKVSAP